ncbi:alpha/beta fold hydrolase (plasmid) [Rhodococcus globerulus]|uniref:alpha/beta fold hydrolase n=1 Tax=Rhodococcus globerulus TaxID=33008 RepID=UPI0039EC760D
MSGTQIIDVAGRATRIKIDGDHSAPPVVLLHGINRSLEDWAAAAVRLAPSFRVVSLDIPGFGFSARRPERASLQSFACGVLETLDALQTLGALDENRPVHLLGNSLGGSIAMQIQAIAPDRVASLSLADAAGFGSQITPMVRLLGTPVVGRALTKRSSAFGAKMTERSLHANPAFATPERIAHALAIADQQGPGIVAHEAAHALTTIRGVRQQWRDELMDRLTRTPRPTLVMWGEEDRVLPVAQLATAKSLIPHARTHLFTGTGHMPQIERPTEFAELVGKFIAAASSSTSR